MVLVQVRGVVIMGISLLVGKEDILDAKKICYTGTIAGGPMEALN
jgi:hypothetical protein